MLKILPPIALLGLLALGCARNNEQPAADSSSEVELGAPRIILRWQTETESNTFGYYVYRAESADGEMACINAQNPVHAQGNSTTPMKYVYFDLAVEPNTTYYYKLQSKDLDGSTEWIVGAENPVPAPSKPLTETELAELRSKGRAYRFEAP